MEEPPFTEFTVGVRLLPVWDNLRTSFLTWPLSLCVRPKVSSPTFGCCFLSLTCP